MSKYTKGPWMVVSDTCDCEYPCSHKPYPIGIDKVDWDAMSWADANLIAAAPELLEALKEMVNYRAETDKQGNKLDIVYQDYDVVIAMNAIAKAKGDNQ